ncbi:hypothetical protein FRB97_006409 [Tulasnella sp. 331]|nr:hypothetical protein FRB97_006409 [Tulasnella sp. 331]
MFSWISSMFRPAESPKIEDIEAAYKPEVVTRKASVPLGSRTFNFVFGVLSHKGPTLWWRDLKALFTRSTLTVTMVLPRTVAPRTTPPTPPPSTHQPPAFSDPEMIELSLTSTATSSPLRPPQAAAKAASKVPLPPSKIDTNPSRLSFATIPTPLPTPPVTPSPGPQTYMIPDFIAYSPYELQVNRHYQPVASISEHWLRESLVHPNEKKRAVFEACNIGLLTAMAYPHATNDRFRVLCDFDNALFAFDDLCDEGGLRADGNGTKKAADIIMSALHYPFTYETEFRCGKIFADLWGRAIQIGCSEGAQRRFLEYFDQYVQAVHAQVLNRAKNHIPDLENWIKLRRDTGGLKMCFAIGEFGLNLDLPDEVFECPLIRVMENCANDVVVLSNDIYSYNIEQAQGDSCNIISVAMQQSGLDVQASMDFAGEQVKGRIDLYTATKSKLPSWGAKVDADVQKYLSVLEDWMTAGFNWSLESQRYFGKDVQEVKRTLRVKVLPREAPRGQIIIPDLERAS